MKNTEYSLNALQGTISSEFSFENLVDMIDDLGLEIVSVARA